MFNNLKKKINSLGANSPTLRALSFADGDGIKREASDSQTKETLAEDGSTLSKHPGVGDFSSGETAASSHVPSVRSDDGTHPDALRAIAESASKDVHSLEMSSSAAPESSATGGVDVQKTNSAALSLEDVDSAADARGEGPRDIMTLDLDCLRQRCCHLQERSSLYKSRLQQSIAAHRITETEKEQLQANLTQALDKHRRQLSELNEQIMLDSHAKRDLENNYALMLDEKDEMIQVLRMKIKLLKDGSTGDAGNSAGSSAQDQAFASELTSDASETQLKDKVRRLELLLTRCKDTIKTNKEKIQQLDSDRVSMSKLAQEKAEELEKFKEHSEKTVLDLQRLLTVAEGKLKTQDNSDQNKRTREIEMDRMASLESQNKLLQETVEKLEKSGQQQLDKSREIIRQLKEQKHQLEEQIKSSENSRHTTTTTTTQGCVDYNVEVSRGHEQPELKIKELLEVNEKNKMEFEKKLNELTLQHSSVVDNFEEARRTEAQKVAELEAAHRTKVNELAVENKILAEASEEFRANLTAKAEEMCALLQKNCELEKQLKVILDSDKQDDLRKQIAELDKTVEKWELDFRDQNEKFLVERQSLQERVKELEILVDNQQEIFSQETDQIRANIEENQSPELLLKVKKYEEEIERLRREIEAKNIHVIGESSDSSIARHPDTCRSHKSVETMNQISENLVSDQKQASKLLEDQTDNQSPAGLRSETNLADVRDVPDDVTARLEVENSKLKETNALLMEENETSKSLILDFEKAISILTADAASQQDELGQRLASSTEVVAQLEQRINDSMERENQLNMELETAKIENEQTVAMQSQKIISLNETIEKLTTSEQLLQDSLRKSQQEMKALQDATTDSGKLANDELTTLKSLIDRLKISEEGLEKTNALLNEEMRSLRGDFDELCSSKKILEDANKSLSGEVDLLKATVEQLRISEQTAKDASALSVEEIHSLGKIIEHMKSSEELMKVANASLNDELVSCKGVAEQLRASEQISKEAVSSQNEEINSLKAAIDRLKSSEITLLDRNNLELQEMKDTISQEKGSVKILNDTVASQAEEINSLKIVIDQLKMSEKMHLEENASLNNDLTVLRDSILRLKNEETILKEANILQNEEIRSLKEIISEIKTSEAALVAVSSSQSEEISSLKTINEQIRSSEQRWKDEFSSKSAEVSSLHAMIEQLQSSERTLRETSALNSNELSFVNSWNPLQTFYPAVDNVQKSLAKKPDHLRLEVEELPDADGTGLHVFKVKEPFGDHLTYQKDLTFELESEEVIKKLAAEIELLNLRLHEKEKLQKHFDTEKRILLEKLEAVENFESSDQQAEIDLHLELDQLEEKAQHGLEIIYFMEQVKHLEEEIILMKQSYVRSPLLASAAMLPLDFISRNRPLQGDDNAVHLKQQNEMVRDRNAGFDDSKEECKAANEKLDVFLAEKVKDSDRTELTLKHIVDEQISSDLERMENLNRDAGENLSTSRQDVREIGRKSAEEKEKSDRMHSEIFQDLEVFGFQNTSQSVEFLSLGHSGECSDLDSNQNLLELDKAKNVPGGEDVELEEMKSQNAIKLYESRISDLEQTQVMLQEDLTVLMERFNAVTDRCSKAEKDAEHYKWMALENGANKAGVLSELATENEAGTLVDEVTGLKLKLEESRMELEHLRQKLQCSEDQGPSQNAKELESCFSLGSGELVASKSESEVARSSLGTNLLTSGQKDAFLSDAAAALAACSSLSESENSSELEMLNTSSKTYQAEDAVLGIRSESSEFELVRRRFESELSGLRNRYEDEVVGLKIKNEESTQFYETRIADLEQTSMALQEDVTVLIEKLNVLKEQCAEANKTAHHYKLLVEDLESKGSNVRHSRELEQDPKTSEGEDTFLKEQIKTGENESQHWTVTSGQEKGKEQLVSDSLKETIVGKQLDVDSGNQFSGVWEKTTSHSSTFMLPARADSDAVLEFERNSLRLGNFSPVDQMADYVNLPAASIPQEYSNMSIQNPAMDEIEKMKLEFKSELKKYSLENTKLKTIQKELMDEVKSLKSSIQASMYSNADRLFVSESTELEYLRHILYKYMLGMETKTLAKVICTVVKFSPEETRKVLDREDARAKIFPTNSR